jgi:RNA polymerase sigma-70 factor, ECF subfamily
MDESDCQLIERIAQSDQIALQQIYTKYVAQLRAYLLQQLCGDISIAEEALQDVFVGIWQAASAYRGEAQVKTWIFRIAHFCVVKQQRVQRRHPSSALSTRLPDDSQENQIENMFPSLEGFEDEIIDRMTLDEAWRKLSEKHQEVLDLVFLHGFTLEEVAHILNIPSGTVKSRISYARRALLNNLGTESIERRLEYRES